MIKFFVGPLLVLVAVMLDKNNFNMLSTEAAGTMFIVGLVLLMIATDESCREPKRIEEE